MKRKTFDCPTCGGVREVSESGLSCTGCAGSVIGQKPRMKPAKIRCPKCGSGSYHRLDRFRRHCNGCGGIYELPDVGYLDTRPDVNAEKAERLARQTRGSQR